MRTIETIRQALADETRRCSVTLAAWAARFEKDPAHAFEWSERPFLDAARLEVYGQVLGWLDKGIAAEAILKEIEEEFLRRAGRIASSTSRQHNAMEDIRRQAWSNLYGWINEHRWVSL